MGRGGRFEDGTIGRWLEEAGAVLDAVTTGPQILVASSMGGRVALHLALAFRDTARIAGLVLVAVDAARLGDRLRWEKARDGALFPHLYGPLFPAEAASIEPLPLGPDGEHLFPPLV